MIDTCEMVLTQFLVGACTIRLKVRVSQDFQLLFFHDLNFKFRFDFPEKFKFLKKLRHENDTVKVKRQKVHGVMPIPRSQNSCSERNNHVQVQSFMGGKSILVHRI